MQNTSDMRVLWLPVLVILAVVAVLPLPAQAQPPRADATATAAPREEPAREKDSISRGSAPQATETIMPRIAFGVNSPRAWLVGAVGVSGYVGFGQHHAVRANFARYNNPAMLGEALAAFSGGGGTGYGGGLIDYGVGWVWYPRKLWDGFLFEAGAIRRDRDTTVWPEFEPEVRTRSTAYAARAMVGWSWLIPGNLFIALAAGLSIGHESGHETSMDDRPPYMVTKTAVERDLVDAETYVRIGFAFGS